ncbi:MAG: IS4 family transposase, partial [Candidatus Sedimenticola sp. (ex Thyasira tokunagai)]
SENAVKSQIWIAISVYVLVAIIKKRLNIDADLYTILQILSLTLFEKSSLFHMLTESEFISDDSDMPNQLNLFNNFPGH